MFLLHSCTPQGHVSSREGEMSSQRKRSLLPFPLLSGRSMPIEDGLIHQLKVYPRPWDSNSLIDWVTYLLQPQLIKTCTNNASDMLTGIFEKYEGKNEMNTFSRSFLFYFHGKVQVYFHKNNLLHTSLPLILHLRYLIHSTAVKPCFTVTHINQGL